MNPQTAPLEPAPAEAPPGLDPPEGAPEWRSPRANLARHLTKSVVRLLFLVTADVGAVLVGRELIRSVRVGVLGEGATTLLNQSLPQASVNGMELAVAVVAALWLLGGYRGGDRWHEPVRILTAVGAGVLLSLYAYMWMENPVVVLVRGLIIWALLGLTLVLVRNVLHRLAQKVPRRRFAHRVLEVKGDGSSTEPISLGPQHFTLAVLPWDALPEDMEAMDDWLEGGVDTVVVSGQIPNPAFGNLADFALTHGCRLLCAPRSPELVAMDPNRVWFDGMPLYELTAPSLRASQLVFKRALDVVGSAVLLLVLSPVMLLTAVAIKLESPGPVFFRQVRAGYGGRFFRVFKFRSMRSDAEDLLKQDPAMWQRYVENDFKLPDRDDPRITPLGRFLRKTSLDELPQLFNVLKGDMSLVGPRPVVPPELEMYRGRIPTLLSVKPGVTGLWQVSGRSHVGFPERAKIDLDYVRNWSLLRDLWILFMTVPAVLYQRGAH